MKIIIEIKETATLSRIEELSKALDLKQSALTGYSDVIKSINKEW